LNIAAARQRPEEAMEPETHRFVDDARMILPELEYQYVEDGVSCTVRWSERFQSHSGHVHGGMVAVALDEAMGHCAYRLLGSRVVTTLLRVRFVEPTRPGVSYRLLVSAGDRTADSVVMSAELLGESLLAAASASFRKLPTAASFALNQDA
jgi:acyl-coenzyme A thioesterase PaaI-like protein